MRIASVADLHGHLSHTIPECDILAICGDIVPLYSSAENWKHWQEYDWMKRKFVRWLNRQPYKHCIITWGNHDIVAFAPDTRAKLYVHLKQNVRNLTILDPADGPSVEIERVTFSGYPYTPTIQQRNWAYSLPRGDYRNELALDRLASNTDVLLSHGPPNGFIDEGHGCAQLSKWIIDNAPSHVLCGHIHECRGQRAWMWNGIGKQTRIVNVSVCDRNYSAAGAKVQVIDL